MRVRDAQPADTGAMLRCLEAFEEEHALVEEDGGTGEPFDADDYMRWLPPAHAATDKAFVAERDEECTSSPPQRASNVDTAGGRRGRTADARGPLC